MEEALTRECAEEGNIAFTAPVLRSVHFNHKATRRDHVAFYLIEQFEQTAPKLPDREIAEAGFFPLEHLPKDTTPATQRRIGEVLRGEPVSPYW
jgi:ADP-ribose pyrophosphatase YjhB (NUDIX family)